MAPRTRTKRPVQMRDVAEHAGVSISTVSHIINNTRAVAPDTRARVLDAIRELSYHKNAIGRRLARGRSDSFGLIISDIENPFFGELIKSFETAVQGRGFDVLLCTTNYDPERARKAVERMIENKVQGVAVMTSQLDPAFTEELLRLEIPVAALDAGPAKRGRSSIQVDYSVGALEAMAHLRDLGHRRIGLISGPLNRLSATTYRKLMIEAAESLEMPALALFEGTNDLGGGEAGVHALMARSEPPTAFVCGNDLTALGAIRGLAELRLKVPGDVSVIGSDDIPFARYGAPALTTIRIPRDEMGRRAFECLERMVRSKRQTPGSVTLETHLVIRESTGSARVEDCALGTSAGQ